MPAHHSTQQLIIFGGIGRDRITDAESMRENYTGSTKEAETKLVMVVK